MLDLRLKRTTESDGAFMLRLLSTFCDTFQIERVGLLYPSTIEEKRLAVEFAALVYDQIRSVAPIIGLIPSLYDFQILNRWNELQAEEQQFELTLNYTDIMTTEITPKNQELDRDLVLKTAKDLGFDSPEFDGEVVDAEWSGAGCYFNAEDLFDEDGKPVTDVLDVLRESTFFSCCSAEMDWHQFRDEERCPKCGDHFH